MTKKELEEHIADIFDKFPAYKDIVKTFVETGTYRGRGIVNAYKTGFFSKLYTVELIPELSNIAQEYARENGIANTEFAIGDSRAYLKHLVPTLESTFFFIDAHQSGPDTIASFDQVPLMDELRIIVSSKLKHIIFLFDDVRFWKGHEKEAWDWQFTENDIIKTITKAGYNIVKSEVDSDRFLVIADLNE